MAAGLAVLAGYLLRHTGSIAAALLAPGWCVAAALVLISGWSVRQGGVRRALGLVPYCAAAVVGFLLLGWGSTRRWFVASGFFVPDNPSAALPGSPSCRDIRTACATWCLWWPPARC